MPVLAVAVVLVGAVCLLNLLLTFGVIRRLREQRTPPPAGDDELVPAGLRVGEFTATDTDGRQLSHAGLAADSTLVGFFTPGCAPCQTLLPEFIAAAPGTGHRVLGVVVGGPDPAGYAERLAEVAQVVVGRDAERIAAALQVRGYPALCVVDGGVVTASGTSLRKVLPAARV